MGSAPTKLGKLSSLQELFLDPHQLTGSVPPELEKLGGSGEFIKSFKPTFNPSAALCELNGFTGPHSSQKSSAKDQGA